MSCEDALELIMDSLVAPLPPHKAARLEAHLEECASCRAEARAYGALWSGIPVAGQSPRPGDHEERFSAKAREVIDNEFSPPKRRFGVLQLAAAIALLAIGGLFGVAFMAGDDGTDAPVVAVDERSRFLVIMTRPVPGAGQEEEANAAIQQWFADLAAGGISEPGSGMRLGELIGAPPDGPLLDESTVGIIVIRAEDGAAARRIIGASPIIDYGGFIEIRELQ